MLLKRIAATLSLIFCAAQLTAHAQVTVTQLTSASQLSSKDTAFVDKDAVQTVYAGPAVTFKNGNDNLTFSRQISGAFETDVAGVNYGDTAFSNGTVLVGAGGFQGPGDGLAVTIKFAAPVIQFGMDIEDFDPTANNYSLEYYALDPIGK